MRERWSSKTIFIFAAIGSAVGLGNIWRFPYMTYKYGGGAFIIPFLIAMVLLGIPLLILEFAIGQKFQKGPVGAFKKIDSRLRGIGAGAVISGFIICVYYAVVMAWTLIYFVKSFSLKLPWAANAENYFFSNVLNLSDSISSIGGINWVVLISLLGIWIAIYFCVRNGVQSIGKALKLFIPLPLILLVVLFFRGITLPGALTGIFYYIKPDFTVLFSSELWIAAASQVFFTLSLGFGVMTAYASYNDPKQDITKSSIITGIADGAISLFAGFVVFSIIGYMAQATSSTVAEVATSGPGLAFVVFPQALSLMPFAAVFSVLFFLTLFSLGIDSAFSLVEAVVTVIEDKTKKIKKETIALVVCAVMFCLGTIFATDAGLYFLDIFDHFITNFGLILVGIFECIAVGWIYGAENIRSFVNSVSDWKIGKWWNVSINYLIPIILGTLLIVQFVNELSGNYGGYPSWSIYLGWTVVLVPFVTGLVMVFNNKN
ncbi:sodium-dependent transporter [Candidatus Woesearchaeota archaeon]|jgi:neurotransmitter:Na+ symporter, NSS family|nr:sodium-dependent transporter [Candidatus Woesearchaeota archaeon]MBT6518273.1 sodium-dependent transporter [Candidatus Woesearchaeota archaeon]MBT7367056.1 sodium-dependent transporter [Candidatus Woesearchaeota archaeon]